MPQIKPFQRHLQYTRKNFFQKRISCQQFLVKLGALGALEAAHANLVKICAKHLGISRSFTKFMRSLGTSEDKPNVMIHALIDNKGLID